MSENRSLHIATETDTFHALKRKPFLEILKKLEDETMSEDDQVEWIESSGWTVEDFMNQYIRIYERR